MSTAARYLAAIDADLQYDEVILPSMVEKIQAENLDVVVGTRNVPGASMGAFAKERVYLSNLGRSLSRLAVRRTITDPMSGCFVMTRSFVQEGRALGYWSGVQGITRLGYTFAQAGPSRRSSLHVSDKDTRRKQTGCGGGPGKPAAHHQ